MTWDTNSPPLSEWRMCGHPNCLKIDHFNGLLTFEFRIWKCFEISLQEGKVVCKYCKIVTTFFKLVMTTLTTINLIAWAIFAHKTSSVPRQLLSMVESTALVLVDKVFWCGS